AGAVPHGEREALTQEVARHAGAHRAEAQQRDARASVIGHASDPTVTRALGAASMRSGLRSARPKPWNDTRITSPSASATSSPKLKAHAPKKWTCASPARRCASYLKWWCSR